MKSVALIGLMGCGKSTIGKLLAQKLNMDFVDIDQKIEEQEGITISEIFANKGEAAFREIETKLLKTFSSSSNLVLATGGGAVQKEENIATLKENCATIYLKASPEVLFDRIKDDKSRPLLQNNNPLETLRELLNKREANYLKADIIVETEHKSVDEILDEITKNVKS
jgi:shikimate kinase